LPGANLPVSGSGRLLRLQAQRLADQAGQPARQCLEIVSMSAAEMPGENSSTSGVVRRQPERLPEQRRLGRAPGARLPPGAAQTGPKLFCAGSAQCTSARGVARASLEISDTGLAIA